MGIQCRLRCSECATIRDVDLKPEDRDITCPVCGRRIQNLTAEEHREVEAVQKKQKLFSIISLVFLAFTVLCIILWAGDTGSWISGYVVGPDGKAVASATPKTAQEGFFFGAVVCSLVTLVLGILGSLKRFVVEF